jgi:hypothetical protein
MTAPFELPGPSHHTLVMGMNGTGKTIMGAWILSKQDFHRRPWVALDFKNEEFWDLLGSPYMRPLKLSQMPGKNGLYRLRVLPGQEDELEDWLWKVWRRGNVGIFVDEKTMMDPRSDAFKAIMRTGRSLRIPVIACTQRPADVGREVFTESRFKVVFKLADTEDYKRIKQFMGGHSAEKRLPPLHSYWYDEKADVMRVLTPVPDPDTIARAIKAKVPVSWMFA